MCIQGSDVGWLVWKDEVINVINKNYVMGQSCGQCHRQTDGYLFCFDNTRWFVLSIKPVQWVKFVGHDTLKSMRPFDGAFCFSFVNQNISFWVIYSAGFRFAFHKQDYPLDISI